MTWDDAVDRLPAMYAAALRLRRAGIADAAIAESIGVDPLAIPTTLKIAEAKLRRELGLEPPEEP